MYDGRAIGAIQLLWAPCQLKGAFTYQLQGLSLAP